jgi:hypothetical protein
VKTIAISQSMYFPWLGFFELLGAIDELVYLDDAQFSRGTFSSRVQIGPPSSRCWLSLPVQHSGERRTIECALLSRNVPWVDLHLDLLRRQYQGAPAAQTMMQVADHVLSQPFTTVSEVNRATILALLEVLGLRERLQIQDSRGVAKECSAGARIIALCQHFGASRYVTAHGGLSYLDEEKFSRAGIELRVIKYSFSRYPQGGSSFDPHVSALDALARIGYRAKSLVNSSTQTFAEALATHDRDLGRGVADGS